MDIVYMGRGSQNVITTWIPFMVSQYTFVNLNELYLFISKRKKNWICDCDVTGNSNRIGWIGNL
jgi:hypothetical protein